MIKREDGSYAKCVLNVFDNLNKKMMSLQQQSQVNI